MRGASSELGSTLAGGRESRARPRVLAWPHTGCGALAEAGTQEGARGGNWSVGVVELTPCESQVPGHLVSLKCL